MNLWEKNDFIQRSNNEKGKECNSGFSYNSGTNENFLSVEKLQNLIENEL